MERNVKEKNKTHPTMMDVAKAAGVSKSAVSKALNNKPGASKQLKSQIFEICEKLGYQINFRIQDMVKERINGMTYNIAFVMVGINFSDPAYSQIIDGIATGVNKHNLRLLLERLNGSERVVYDLPPILRDHRVDGFLISGCLNKNMISIIRKLKLPCVVIGSYPEKLLGDLPCIQPDYDAGMNAIIKELKATNHKHPAFVSENITNDHQKQLLRYFKLSLKKYDIPYNRQRIHLGEEANSGALGLMQSQFKQKNLSFDSVVCLDYATSQEISHLAYGHSQKFGVKPITIATTNDVFARHARSVPTIYCDMRMSDIACKSVSLLSDMINSKNISESKLLFPITVSKLQPGLP